MRTVAIEAGPVESSFARGVRLVGILAFAVTLFLPVHSCGGGPRAREPAASRASRASPESVQIPIDEITQPFGRAWRKGGPIAALWRVRTWYPYLLIPIWLLALGLAAIGPRSRRAAGWMLTACAIGIAVFEWVYLDHDYGGILPIGARRFEIALAWGVVVAVLFVRRRGRTWTEPEAHVSAQALLTLLHALMFLVGDAITYSKNGHGVGVVLDTLRDEYRIGYWVALSSLVAIVVPGIRRPSASRDPVSNLDSA